MRFKQYQAGGAIYTPFISSRGASQGQVNPYTTSTSSSKSEKADNKIRDEIVKVLQESGINNDVDSFLQVANDFLVKSQSLSNASLFGGSDNSYSISDLTYVLSLANKVKQNKLQWDAAATNLKTQNNSNEVAVASNGHLYVRSEDGFTTVSPEEFANNRDKYDALTNSQVLGLRQKLPGLAFNTDILNDMAGSISLETIQKQLLDIIDKFGETTRSEYVRRTGDNVSQSAWNGMRILIDQGPDGYYKVTNKTDLVNVESALDYLWKSLGADGQKRLRAEVAISGGDPTKNRYDLIAQMLEHHTSFTQDPSFDSAATKSASDAGGGTDLKPQWEDDPYLSVIAKGKGIRERISITPSTNDPIGQQIGMKVWGINIGQLVDRNGNIIEQTSLPDALKKGEVFRGRPDVNVTFGNKVLTEEEQKTIVLDEATIAYVVDMPYKDTLNGVVPDFSMIDVYESVNKTLADHPEMNNIERTNLLIQNGIDPSKLSITEDGTWYVKTKAFIRFGGYVSDDLVDLSDDTKQRFLDPVDKSEAKGKVDLFNKLLKFGIRNPEKNTDKVNKTWAWFGGGDWDREDIHRGYIYVTAPDEWIAALMTNQNKIDKHLLSDIDKRIYMSRAQQDSPLITQF